MKEMWGHSEKWPSREASREIKPTNTLISVSCPPERWETNLLRRSVRATWQWPPHGLLRPRPHRGGGGEESYYKSSSEAAGHSRAGLRAGNTALSPWRAFSKSLPLAGHPFSHPWNEGTSLAKMFPKIFYMEHWSPETLSGKGKGEWGWVSHRTHVGTPTL